MPLRSQLFVLGMISAAMAAGCADGPGGSDGPLVPVGGTLLVDGKPLDGVVVTFIPEVAKKNSRSRGGTGTTDAAGVFNVTDLDQSRPGLPVGKYVVSYSRMRLPEGSAPPEAGAPANPGLIKVETLPAQLTSPDPKLPSNQVLIPKDGNTKLELKVSKTLSPALMGPG